MSLPTIIKDGTGTGCSAKVSARGQLVTAPLDFSTLYPKKLDVINTAFNYVGPLTEKVFVITDIILYANKDVGPADAIVDIYETSSATSATILRSIFQTEIPKYSNFIMTGLNLITSEGVWLNGKTNDNSIFTNIGGYYIDA